MLNQIVCQRKCNKLLIYYWWVLQVTCTPDKLLDLELLALVAVQPRLRTTVGTPVMVVTRIRVILSVLIKAEKATKVGMQPALLNPASKALISKSGPPHDHFNLFAKE